MAFVYSANSTNELHKICSVSPNDVLNYKNIKHECTEAVESLFSTTYQTLLLLELACFNNKGDVTTYTKCISHYCRK